MVILGLAEIDSFKDTFCKRFMLRFNET